MHSKTKAELSAIAPSLIKGVYPSPCSVTVQRAIAILEILKDGEWHTAPDIAKRMITDKPIKPLYVNDILRCCKNAWGLESIPSRTKGWRLKREQ